ncbi:MAG TPA: hypothetical protein VFG54_14210 [Prolixibacteraceae bacterium]|nr:hypothetical protein [Prolixibacteraceae bacterium]
MNGIKNAMGGATKLYLDQGGLRGVYLGSLLHLINKGGKNYALE